jgi:hypothetical protein
MAGLRRRVAVRGWLRWEPSRPPSTGRAEQITARPASVRTSRRCPPVVAGRAAACSPRGRVDGRRDGGADPKRCGWATHLSLSLPHRLAYVRCMREHPENPSSNQLAAGVTEEDMMAAVEGSGYGLQSVAVDKIMATAVDVLETSEGTAGDSQSWRIQCQEEWSYIDSDSQDSRNLDALISVDLTSSDSSNKPRAESAGETLRIHLDLLIECKQSELPFVFFMRRTRAGDVPRIIGLPHELLSVKLEDHDFAIGMRTYDVLGLRGLPLTQRAETAISMSKTHRRGKSLELSGEEAFRGVALPLSKALRYYEGLTQPKEPKLYTHVRLVMPVAVVRAPMVGVSLEDGEPRLTAMPWVRLIRMDPGDDSPFSQFCEPVAIDVVHVDFLETYARITFESGVIASQRLVEFAVPCLTGEAIAMESLEISGDRSRKPSYLFMRPSISEEEFMKRWLERFWRAHSRTPQDSEGSA